MDRRQVPVEYAPGEAVSTASNREDVLLWRAFRGKKDGFYIDVGAGDPNYGSVTRWFYCNSWKGINIEPHPEVFPILHQWRPRDINVNCAVSDRTGQLIFHKVVIDKSGLGWGLSSLNPESADRSRASGAEVEKILVKTVTLKEIVDRYCRDIEVDYLKIDVENHEEAVIRSADWSHFRPKVLCIEATFPMSATPSFSQWETLVLGAGYIFALFDGFNNYYVRPESPEILTQFNCGVNSADHWRVATRGDFKEPWLHPGDGKSIQASSKLHKALDLPIEKYFDGGQSRMSEDLVRSAYRVLLGREPENDVVVGRIAAAAGDSDAILQAFVDCPEFTARTKSFSSVVSKGFSAPRLPVETDVSSKVLHRLFDRIKMQWKELGEREPYWSVVSKDSYLRSNFDEHQSMFEESGRGHAAMVDYLPSRNGIAMRGGTCLELGCGVGRVTRFLAEKFERVIAVDISPGNLDIAKEYLERSGINNVTTRLLSEPGEIVNLEGFDFFYSIIVLQHNPPPVQKFILKHILGSLRNGGCALFQVPTFRTNYGFSADSYLLSSVPHMEMHALPMDVIFSIFDECGLSCKEVIMDDATGDYGSHTFVAHKR